MKPHYIILGIVVMLGYNSFLAKRDVELFEAYDKKCAELSSPIPECRYAK